MKKNNGLNEFINNINNSNANFISRLKDKNRNYIKDWNSNRISTHKMSYAEVDGKYIIYPEIQELKQGTLFDFTDPKYNLNWKDALKSALDRNDYIIAPSEDMAIEYTKNYKNYYPSFKIGGTINNINLINNNMYVKKRFGTEPIEIFKRGGKPNVKRIERNKKKVSKYKDKLNNEDLSDRKRKRYEKRLNKAESKLGDDVFNAIQTGREALYSQGFREQPTRVINNTHTSFGAPTDPFLLEQPDVKNVQRERWSEIANRATQDFLSKYGSKPIQNTPSNTPSKPKNRFELIETPFQKINKDLNEHREKMKKEYPLWLGDNKAVTDNKNTKVEVSTEANTNVSSPNRFNRPVERVSTKNTGIVNKDYKGMSRGLNRSIDSLRNLLGSNKPQPTQQAPISRPKPRIGVGNTGVVNTQYEDMARALRRNRGF